jgi:hypothetical protein
MTFSCSRVPRILAFAILLAASAVSPRAATITGFTPDRGGPGTEVTLTGVGLQTTLFVYFGAFEATGEILSRTANSVRARVPPNAFTGQLSVFTSGSGSASSLQVFVTTPRIEEVEPPTGAPGALITLSGANFGTGQPGSRGNVTSVLFNGRPALFDITGINQLLTQVPPDATTGPITVANEAGSFTTLVPFHVAPLLTSFSPTNGMPGDPIEIRGSNLGTALRIEFGLEPAAFTVVSPSNVIARVPTNAINGRLQITTPAGNTASTQPFVVRPRILQFLPAFGATGTNVTLQGGGFHGTTAVDFNGTTAAFTVRSSTLLDAVVPANATSGPLRITTTNGTFTTSEFFHLPARINSFNPNSGRSGDSITIDGQNLAGTTRVLFNGVEASFTLTSPTRLTAVIPPAATSGRITVESPAGSILSSGTFNVIPVLDGFNPTSASQGSPINLSGSGLTNLVWVRLADVDMSFTLLSPTNIRAIVPLNAFSGPIRARNLNGVEFQAPGTFIVDGARPAISSFSPASGQAGTVVRIQGAGLRSASRVQFNGTDAAQFAVVGNAVDATVPASATTGPIAVTTLDGIALSTNVFTIGQPVVSLSILRGPPPNAISLRWPTQPQGFLLESSPSLGTNAAWSNVPGTPATHDGFHSLPIPHLPPGNTYYRLRKP